MFRSQYDTDVTVWSPPGPPPPGRVRHGGRQARSACLGLVGKDGVVLAALKRQPNELSGHQKKLLKIDDHLVIAVAGLNADARTLAKVMRTKCLNRYVYGAPPLQGARPDKTSRTSTRGARRRTSGDPTASDSRSLLRRDGAPPLRDVPVGQLFEFVAVAIGARAQSAKTYLEKHHKTFKDTPVEELCTRCRHWPVWKSTGVPLSRPRCPRFGSDSDTTSEFPRDRIQRATPRIEGRLKFHFPTGVGRRAATSELDAAAASLAVVTADGQSRLIEDKEVQGKRDLVEVEGGRARPGRSWKWGVGLGLYPRKGLIYLPVAATSCGGPLACSRAGVSGRAGRVSCLP